MSIGNSQFHLSINLYKIIQKRISVISRDAGTYNTVPTTCSRVRPLKPLYKKKKNIQFRIENGTKANKLASQDANISAGRNA